MTRTALRLAALASSAVPGLDPVSVEGHAVQAGDLYELAFVTDSQDRHWVVKAARTAAAGALLEDVSALMALLARRLEVTVPVVRGVAAVPSGRAVVHARVPGQALDLGALPPGAPLTADVGRTLAHIHNLELAVFEEAGRPGYDAETHRKRMLSELDRASASGHVPSGLLSRWEHRLEDVSLWRFVPTPVHGSFTGPHVLATFEDEDDGGSGHVRGVIGWEESRLGDPADDLAALVAEAEPGALDTVLEAYVQSRIERPDANLLTRARLGAEMTPVRSLLRALSARETRLVERVVEQLRDLDEQIRAAEERAEARRVRAERRAREERERAQAEQATVMSAPAAAGSSVDEATQGFTPPAADSADEATQPFAGPSPASGQELTQPFAPFAVDPEAEEPPASPNAAFEGERAGTPASSPTNTAFDGDGSGDDGADDAGDAVDDSHEGASHFVAVERRRVAENDSSPGA